MSNEELNAQAPQAQWIVMRAGEKAIFRASNQGDIEITMPMDELKEMWSNPLASNEVRCFALLCCALLGIKARLDGGGGIIVPASKMPVRPH